MFQIEILEGEHVYAWNICDEGFDTEEEITNYIVKYHKDIVIQIIEDLEEEANLMKAMVNHGWQGLTMMETSLIAT